MRRSQLYLTVIGRESQNGERTRNYITLYKALFQVLIQHKWLFGFRGEMKTIING